MKILFLVDRPTQFEAPFYRYVAAHHPDHTLRVLFTAPNFAAPVYDPELKHTVNWGIDLVAGYPHGEPPTDVHHHRLPPEERRQWLVDELSGDRWDLLITNGYKPWDCRQAVALARQAGIATALRLDSVGGGWWARRIARQLRFATVLKRRYDVFLGVSKRTEHFLKSCGIGEKRRGFFPYAVDVNHFRARSQLSPAELAKTRKDLGVRGAAPVVLAVAKLNEREAPWDLLKALPHLDRQVRLLVAGDGPRQDELEAFAQKTAPGQVTFLGYVPYPELPRLYAAADLFVHAAKEEHWGVSVAEALACGLPAIASSGVGAGELIDQERNGFIYAAGASPQLARRIEAALALPRDDVERANDEMLARWDYPAAWEGLCKAAGRGRARLSRRRS